MRQIDYKYQEKFLVAVDCVVFGYEEGELKLLLFQRQLEPEIGKWSLVGGWLNIDESVEVAANRVLKKITGLDNVFLEQVKIFSKPNRDSGGRVLSVVFYSLIDIKSYDKNLNTQFGAKWWSVTKLPDLIFDHFEMYQIATQKLRNMASYQLVGRDLLPKEFTITQLRQLYKGTYYGKLRFYRG